MKLLIFAPYGIGNLILLYPVLKKLKDENIPFDIASFLGSVNYMLTKWPEFEDLYEKRWFINGSKLEIFNTLRAIRKEKYDYSVVSFPSAKPHYNLLSFLCGAKNRVSSRYPDNKPLQTLSFLNTHLVPVLEGAHDVEQNLLLVKATGLLSATLITNIEKFCANSNSKKRKIIGFHVGCSANAQYKRWPLPAWNSLIELLKIEYPSYELHFFFGPDEREELSYFQNNNSIKIRNNLTLMETKNEIAECSLFISNDSGLMHIASLQNVPTISIIGPSDERRTGAFSNQAIVLSGSCEYRPCSHNYYLSSHHFQCKQERIQCMEDVSPDDVLSAIKRLSLF